MSPLSIRSDDLASDNDNIHIDAQLDSLFARSILLKGTAFWINYFLSQDILEQWVKIYCSFQKGTSWLCAQVLYNSRFHLFLKQKYMRLTAFRETQALDSGKWTRWLKVIPKSFLSSAKPWQMDDFIELYFFFLLDFLFEAILAFYRKESSKNFWPAEHNISCAEAQSW